MNGPEIQGGVGLVQHPKPQLFLSLSKGKKEEIEHNTGRKGGAVSSKCHINVPWK